MTYRESLPDGCPPEEAEDVSEPRVVFRLVRNDPPADDDFRSQRAERPNHRFRDATECRVRGLSVHGDIRDSAKTMKLPAQKGKHVCRVDLDAGAGSIQKTGRASHHTWWPLAGFDIIANCSLVQE